MDTNKEHMPNRDGEEQLLHEGNTSSAQSTPLVQIG